MVQQGSGKSWIAGFLIVGALLIGGDWAEAKTANGPYYAPPAWARKMPVNARFVVLKNWNSEAVLDRETGLVWERSPQGNNQNWAQARTTCAGKAIGDRKGWRLPSFVELESLVDPSVAAPGPTLPAGHPFTNVQSGLYWSAATSAENSTTAWSVNYLSGNLTPSTKSLDLGVWCVRGSMNADAY